MTGTQPRRHAATFSLILLAVVLAVGVVFLTKHDSHAEAQPDASAVIRTTADSSPMEKTAQTEGVEETTAVHRTNATLSWSSAQLCSLMQNAISGVSEDVSVSSAELRSPDTVLLSGTVSRSALERLLDSSDVEAKSTLELALKLLPDTMELTAEFTVSVEENRVRANPASLQAASVTLPASVVPDRATEAVNSAIQDALDAAGCTPESIEISDDTLRLICWID